jgi:hypothetical protein
LLQAVSTPLLGTVFTMVPSFGPRVYGQYNANYRSEQPLMPSEENGLHPIAPPIPEHGTRRQPSRSGGQR